MTARGRFLSVLVTIVVALAGFVTLGALPAGASPPIIQYVALGDSYAAGTAVGSFPNCQLGDDGYPEQLLDLGSRIDLQANVACSGATTFAVIDNQLSALKSDTRLVTITVGAANLDLSGLLAVCTQTPANCQAAIIERLALLPALGSDLTDLYAEVAEVAPRARVVVTGYPPLFEPVNPLFIAINDAIDQLNSTIEQAVSVANDANVNIHYVDVTEEFAGHGIVTPITNPDAFIHSLFSINGQPDPEAFHPTPAGYRAYADAISVALPGGWLDKQKQLV
ncbi:MAG TPA: SGNH/GDSL hydrolase family protein [Propionibacteriaceae bacterium]|nr:SGNH/GDSL hydrolase family protein [Propionibacteriaceae bacterium]